MAYAMLLRSDGDTLWHALDVMDRYVTEVVGYHRQFAVGEDFRARPQVSVEWNNEAAADGEEVAVTMEKAAAWWEEQGNL